MNPSLWNLQPIVHVALMGLIVAMGPLSWVWLRNKQAGLNVRLAALTVLTLFLTFDLVVFGAFTRLTDSGLGCPDWPGCYGNASPIGARDAIHAAQTAMPTGPVTHTKAWIEMIHRYLAAAVGVLIMVATLTAWAVVHRASDAREAVLYKRVAWWASLCLGWVVVQGLFGKYTVTLKLYPAIVTMHLVLGLGLLALLAVQAETIKPQGWQLGAGVQRWAALTGVLLLAQVALGGWVSTNYAVLACRDFPSCQGQLWPPADFAQGFTLLRPLGEDGQGGLLSFAALTAIHLAHRIGAGVLLAALLVLAWMLRQQAHPQARHWGKLLAAGAAWQVLSGLSNVVLGWPLLAALAHTAGAAALVIVLTLINVRARRAAGQGAQSPAVAATDAVPHMSASPAARSQVA